MIEAARRLDRDALETLLSVARGLQARAMLPQASAALEPIRDDADGHA